MPIKRLSTTGRAAFPRIGKLRKGGEKGAKGFGADLTYFRFTADKGYEDAAAVFAEIYGDQPQALRVYLPYAEPRRNFDAWQEQWGRGETLIHRCDGETCVKWLEDGKPVTDYEMKQRHPCPGGCKPVGRLEVILPEMWESGYMGLVTMETHSVNDIAHIEAVLAEMYERSDHDKGLQGIAFVLRRKEERIKRATETGMQTMTKWLVKIEPEPEWMLAQLDVARREQLGVTEPDVVAVDDPGDLPVDVETGEIMEDGDEGEVEQLYDADEPEPDATEPDPAEIERVKPLYGQQAKWFKGRLQEIGVTLNEGKRLLSKRLGRDLEFYYDSGLMPQDAITAIALQVADEAEAPGQEGLPI